MGNQLGVGVNLASLWEGVPWPKVSCYRTDSARHPGALQRRNHYHPIPLKNAKRWELVTTAQVQGPSTTALKGIWPFKSWSLFSVREHLRVSEREFLAAWEDATGRAST